MIPLCSAYAISCLRRHGFIMGWRLAISRIKPCKPPYGGQGSTSQTINYSAPHRGAILYSKTELIVAEMRGWERI
ncbi:membrane protein insertion efficiency factor YidD [Klebsiella pneumoniae]|uniref:membrane protein insertion efficiency factor YidD n=1 Tax=Klebsiella pneumoniae TaxID=573 RepID=UPI0039E19184